MIQMTQQERREKLGRHLIKFHEVSLYLKNASFEVTVRTEMELFMIN